MIERFRRQNEDRHRINCGDKWLKQQRMIRTDFWQKLLRAIQSGSQTAVKHRRAARPACVDDSAEYQCVGMKITGGNTPWTPELIIYACENVLLELTQNAATDYEAPYYAGGDRYYLVLQASRSTQDEDIRELMEIFRDFFGKNLDIGVRFRLYRRCTIDAMADALGVSMQDGCQGNTAQMNVPQLDYEHPDTDGWKKLILLGDLDSLSASIRSFLERGIRGQENPADFLGAFQVDWNLLVSAILNENTSLSLTDLRRGGFSRWLTTDLEQTTLLAMEDRLSDTVQNAMMNIITVLLSTSVGATMVGSNFLTAQTLKIVVLGVVAFGISTAGGLLGGQVMRILTRDQVNPLIGSAGVSAVPMAARVSNREGQRANPSNFLLMHAMGPNVAGVIGSAVAAGILLLLFQ